MTDPAAPPDTPPAGVVRIVDYEPRHRTAFRELNLEWITRHFALEEDDRRLLDDPEGAVLAHGGCILMAEGNRGGRSLGCCALLRIGAREFELAKMAVAPEARGRGIGGMLGEAAVARARHLGARRIELLSNTALRPALSLYRKLGFVEVPLGASDYRRADIKMVLSLLLTRPGPEASEPGSQ